MNFVEKALKYKQVTLTVLALFFSIGVYSLFNMSRREDPKITPIQGLIIAYYPGASSTQVEEQLTKPVEEAIFKLSEIKKQKTYSTSRDGVMVITVELASVENHPDIFWSKLRAQLLTLKQTSLPQGVIGPLVNSDFGDTEAMILGISGKGIPYEQLKQYAEQLENQLKLIPAVSKIKRDGERPEQILVSTSSAKMAQYGIKLSDVMKILPSQNDTYPSGSLEQSDIAVPLYTKGFYTSINDLAQQIVVTSPTGAVVRLQDIAQLERSYAPATSKVKINEVDGLIVSIQMMEGNNIVKFGNEVKAVIEKFKENIPSGIEITSIADQPSVVDENISHFIREFFLAIIAVVIVILLMLPFRIALVAAMAIPVTISLTLALLNFFGIELHQVSLASLIVVLGLVVDDAIA